MFLYRLARVLQFLGLVIVPVAVAGNLAEFAEARSALTVKESLLVSAVGMGCFGIGWWLQQQVKPGG